MAKIEERLAASSDSITTPPLNRPNSKERIRALVRIRPPPLGCAECDVVVQAASNTELLIGERCGRATAYTFDAIYGFDATNAEIYDYMARPLVSACLDGVNGTLLAYGQTGTGKTTTLSAPKDGLVPRALRELFDALAENSLTSPWRAALSYLQIYNERLFDLLLVPENEAGCGAAGMPIGQHELLSRHAVGNADHAERLIERARTRLIIGETALNRQSSRSHSIFFVFIEQDRRIVKEENNNQSDQVGIEGSTHCIRSTLTLCDLAGSERIKRSAVSGTGLREALNINLSLLELGNVVSALADNRRKHVPFRNSALTRTLRSSLGGNCKTALVVCVSARRSDVGETKASLNFGQRAMRIQSCAQINLVNGMTESTAKIAAANRLAILAYHLKESQWKVRESELETRIMELERDLDLKTLPICKRMEKVGPEPGREKFFRSDSDVNDAIELACHKVATITELSNISTALLTRTPQATDASDVGIMFHKLGALYTRDASKKCENSVRQGILKAKKGHNNDSSLQNLFEMQAEADKNLMRCTFSSDFSEEKEDSACLLSPTRETVLELAVDHLRNHASNERGFNFVEIYRNLDDLQVSEHFNVLLAISQSQSLICIVLTRLERALGIESLIIPLPDRLLRIADTVDGYLPIKNVFPVIQNAPKKKASELFVATTPRTQKKMSFFASCSIQ